MTGVVGVMGAMHLAGIIHNFTDSVPEGFYRIVNREPRRGDYVIIEPPNNDFTRLRKMKGIIKTLAATGGDRVTIDEQGITVNGKRLEKSAPFQKFATLITREDIDATLAEDEIIVHSGYNALSYDSRYFGIIKSTAIRNVIEPIYTWGKAKETLD